MSLVGTCKRGRVANYPAPFERYFYFEIVILIFVVVVFGFFTLAVAFGVTLTLMVQEPGRSAFTDVPEIEQNFFVVTATTSTTLAPFGILTFAVLLIVVKEVTLPFFITATFETTVGVYVLVLV
jgi:hypothetical protein